MTSSTPQPSVGENLRHLRSDLGLSLSQVASEVGVSVATLSRIETDKQNLDVVLLTRLASILGVPAVEILGDGEESDHSSVTRKLARMPAKDRARAYVDASRRASASIEELLSVLDVLREELARLHQSRARRAKKR